MDKEKLLERVERELCYANSTLDDIKDMLNVPEEVKDFLLDLAVDKDLPKNIQEQAKNLWEKVY